MKTSHSASQPVDSPGGPRRVPGPIVLAGMACTIAGVVGLAVIWARATPGVPDARERRAGFAVPGAEAAAEAAPPGCQPAPTK